MKQAKYKKDKLQFQKNIDDLIILICTIITICAMVWFTGVQ
jgi:hypothetical protein